MKTNATATGGSLPEEETVSLVDELSDEEAIYGDCGPELTEEMVREDFPRKRRRVSIPTAGEATVEELYAGSPEDAYTSSSGFWRWRDRLERDEEEAREVSAFSLAVWVIVALISIILLVVGVAPALYFGFNYLWVVGAVLAVAFMTRRYFMA